MFDFRLQVFQAVAKRLNFTKAADRIIHSTARGYQTYSRTGAPF